MYFWRICFIWPEIVLFKFGPRNVECRSTAQKARIIA